MSNTFFVDWELWQQMSFCLASMIAIVMFAGVCKLHYLNWKSKRIILQDEEKNQRLSEVRRTGLRVKRENDIPFGVRAIESGIEVDGIWISRPTTPVTSSSQRLASVTTLVTEDIHHRVKDFDNPDLIDTASPCNSPRLNPHGHYRPKQPSQLRNSLDGSSPQPRRPGPPSERSSGSSETERHQQPVSQTTHYSQPARDYSPSITSTQANTRTPEDPFSSGSKPNSLLGYPAMEYTDGNSMAQPGRTFVPSQQSHR